MKKNTILFALLFCLKLFSQSPPLQWTKSFVGNGDDNSQSILATPDGGSIVLGYTNTNSTVGDITGNHSFTYDFWIAKLTATGDSEWKKCYGGSSAELAYSIEKTSDNGYVVAGYTQSNNGDVSGLNGYRDFWVIKIDSSGTLLWQKTLGGTNAEEAYDIKETTDGGFVVVGYASSNDLQVTGNHGNKDFWITRLDNNGNLLWQKSFGGTADDEARSVQQTIDGGFIVAGYTSSDNGDVTVHHGSLDYWVIKLSPSGTLEWEKTLGGTNFDRAESIVQNNDGSYTVCGTSVSYNIDIHNGNSSTHIWLVKINSIGSIIWERSYGGSQADIGECMKKGSDGNYLISGFTASNDGDVIGNLNTNGTYCFWTLKIDLMGNILWQKAYGLYNGYEGRSIDQTTDGGYVVAGIHRSGGTNSNFHIIKLGATLGTMNFGLDNSSVYPNPVTNTLFINTTNDIKNVIVYDSLGKEIPTSLHDNAIDVSWLQSGLYILAIQDENKNTFYKKFIKQ